MAENHRKPTKEELAERAKKALEEASKLDPNEDPNNPTPPKKPSASPSPSAPPPQSASASPSPSQPPASSHSASASPSQPPAASASPSPSASDEDDELTKTKKKLSASSKEALILHSRTKKYDEAVEEAEKVEPPTDDEMKAKYGEDEWEQMSAGQRLLAQESWVANKRFEIMSKVSKEGRIVEEWNNKVSEFLKDPKNLTKYPVLEGKQEEFAEFAAKPTRRGLDMEDLILAFTGDLANNPPKKHKGQMFEKGSPGIKDKPKPKDDKISAADAKILRETNYPKWKELLKAGKIRQET